MVTAWATCETWLGAYSSLKAEKADFQKDSMGYERERRTLRS